MFKYKSILIYGFSTSGQSVKKILDKIKVKYKIFDKNKRVYKNLDKKDLILKKINFKTIKSFDLIIISPGISLDDKNLIFAKKNNIKIVGELEVGYWFKNEYTNLIAITGTNGKTTTASLIHKILKNIDKKIVLVGNIGTPLSTIYNKTLKNIICEVSSFQLETIDMFKANISILLNIEEDHLDRHKTFENYIKCKLNLFKNNDLNDIAILNFDDDNVMLHSNNIKNKKYYISTRTSVEGVYLKNNMIFSNLNGITNYICDRKDLKISNVFLIDYLASILVGLLKNISINSILQSVKKYRILSNRCEFVTENDNVVYVNDSKATNIHATIESVKSFKNDIVLLIGGFDKELNLNKLFNKLPNNVKQILVFGQLGKRLNKESKSFNFENIIYFRKMKNAVLYSIKHAVKNSIVLFSPTCSSFDEFKNFDERGKYFKKLVLKNSGKK